MKTWLAFWYGIFKNNPTFRLVLGLCPTLAVTTSLENAIGMGLAATFVLVCSNGLVSALRKVIPAAVHIPCYIVIIATFVTAIDLLMQAYLPDLSASLGIFIPLIVVNCIILGRAEAFACKNAVIDSLADRLGSGNGFALALSLIATVREICGAGTLTVWGDLVGRDLVALQVRDDVVDHRADLLVAYGTLAARMPDRLVDLRAIERLATAILLHHQHLVTVDLLVGREAVPALRALAAAADCRAVARTARIQDPIFINSALRTLHTTNPSTLNLEPFTCPPGTSCNDGNQDSRGAAPAPRDAAHSTRQYD